MSKRPKKESLEAVIDERDRLAKQNSNLMRVLQNIYANAAESPEWIRNRIRPFQHGRQLLTIAEIKQAADEGLDVRCDSLSYKVIKDKIGQYLIICTANSYCVGLTGAKDTEYENRLNGSNFFVVEH